MVAVFGLQNKGTPLAEPVVERMSDYLSTQLVKSGRYKAVPSDELKRALSLQKVESFKECYDESCQIEVGKELAASKVLSGTLLKIGRKCIVTLTMFDLREAAKEAAGSGEGECTEDGVLASVDGALQGFVGGKTVATPRRGVGAVGFGAQLGDLPQLGSVESSDIELPSGTLSSVDIKRRRLIGAARRMDGDAQMPYATRAAAWDELAAYVGDDALGRQAKARANAWRKQDAQICAREKKLEEVRKRRAADQAKLDELLALDKFSATDEEKQAWQEEFDAAYARFAKALNEGPDPLSSCACGIRREIDGLEYVYVCGGVFTMGSNERDDEKPPHRVRVSSFWMQKYEFRRGEAKGRSTAGDPNLPLTEINWRDAQHQCEARGARLPTEAEWEYAARGPENRRYPWGNEPPDERRAHFGDQSGPVVVTARPSGKGPFGTEQQAGNVWEWVCDRYEGDAYSKPPHRGRPASNPAVGCQSADGVAVRVIRGGSFFDSAVNLRSAHRLWNRPGNVSFRLGFRCARSPLPSMP